MSTNPATGGSIGSDGQRGSRRSVFGFAAGRRTKWVVLFCWIVIGVVVAPFSSKLESATKNEESSFLPGGAESTKVLEQQKRFPGGDAVTAVIVYRRATGLTPGDRQEVQADMAAIQGLHLKGVLGVVRGRPSPDGKATLTIVPIGIGDDANVLVDDVGAIRRKIGEGANGLDVKVTGGAGFSADAIEVFSNIDTTLLLWTVIIVGVLLLITYRSPFLWLIPLLTVGFADQAARALAYALARAGVVINGQTSGVLTVLVYGAGTDYALLITARYREELRRHQDKHEAMRYALGRAGPAILASGGTVIAGLLCLLVAQLNSNRGLGPVGAMGIGLALVAMLTLLPALLVILPRGVFWPFVPRFGADAREDSGIFARLGRGVARRPKTVAIATAAVLGVMALGLTHLDTNQSQLNSFRGTVESVEGQKLVAASYPQGATAPTDVLVQPASRVQAAIDAVKDLPGVAAVQPEPVQRAGGLAGFQVVLTPEPYSPAAFDAVDAMRTAVRRAAGPGALVGGASAIQLDVGRAASRDFAVIAPLVLLVVLLILGLLLRAIVAPLMLVLTVILSFAAGLGASVLVFQYLFGFDGIDASLPLLAFIFLVALGVDYNIFLMARVREEAIEMGTTRGMLKGLAVTGGVITSAGVVLAGTFSVLGVLPLVALTEIGFIVAFGVLLDTLVVRSILVPALTMSLGGRTWWPSALARSAGPPAEGGAVEAATAGAIAERSGG